MRQVASRYLTELRVDAALEMSIEEVEVFSTMIFLRFAVTGIIMVQNMLYTNLTGCFFLIYINIIFKLEN